MQLPASIRRVFRGLGPTGFPPLLFFTPKSLKRGNGEKRNDIAKTNKIFLTSGEFTVCMYFFRTEYLTLYLLNYVIINLLF